MNINRLMQSGFPVEAMKNLVASINHAMNTNQTFELEFDETILRSAFAIKNFIRTLCFDYDLPLHYIVNNRLTLKSSKVITQEFINAAKAWTDDVVAIIRNDVIIAIPELVAKWKEAEKNSDALISIEIDIVTSNNALGSVTFKTIPVNNKRCLIGLVRMTHPHLKEPFKDVIIELVEGVYLAQSDLTELDYIKTDLIEFSKLVDQQLKTEGVN